MVEQLSQEGKKWIASPSYLWGVVLVGLLLVVGSGVAYMINHTWVVEAQLGAGVGLILLLLAVLRRPDVVRTFLAGRPVRYASNALITSLAFIGLMGLLNLLGLRYDHEYDLTETGEFTLSEQTIQILRYLDKPVHVIGFFKAEDGRLKLAQNYLERYSRYTDKLTYEFYDPKAEPGVARSLEVSNYGLVFISDNHRHEITGVDEQMITASLIRVTSQRLKTVSFIAGHGSYSLTDNASDGYSMIKQALERENYQVTELNLAAQTSIPTDTDVLVIGGAKRSLSETETGLVSDWMIRGGRLMLLVDPLQLVPLKGLLPRYGLSLADGFIVDMTDSLVTLTPNGFSRQVTAPLLTRYPFHEITRGLAGSHTFFPFVRAINIGPAASQSGQVVPILATSHGSWIEKNTESPDLEYNEGIDLPGPVSIGVAVDDEQTGARLVVVGNASFITNQYLSSEVANEDLFLNAVNWLAEEDTLVSIRPRQPASRQLVLTPVQHSLTLLTSLFLMPLTVLMVGVVVWWNRQ